MDSRINDILSQLEKGDITYNQALNGIINLKIQNETAPKKRTIFGAPKKISGIKIQIKYYDDENVKFKNLNLPGIPLWLFGFMSNFMPASLSNSTNKNKNYYITSSSNDDNCDNTDEDIVVIEESSSENHGKSIKKTVSYSQLNLDKKTVKRILKELKTLEPFTIVSVDSDDAKVLINAY